jgi:hypothetical protein
MFHLVPLCPFFCQTKDFNTTFSQPELVSCVPFPPCSLDLDEDWCQRQCSSSFPAVPFVVKRRSDHLHRNHLCRAVSIILVCRNFRFAGSTTVLGTCFWNLDFLMEVVCWRNYVVAILGFEYWFGDFVSDLWINFVFYLSPMGLFLLLICHSNLLCFPYTLLISFLGSVGGFQDFAKLSSCV